jgi:sugar/nucleoside kinase (ribokinase family)
MKRKRPAVDAATSLAGAAVTGTGEPGSRSEGVERDEPAAVQAGLGQGGGSDQVEAVVGGHLCLDIIPRFEPQTALDPAAFLSPGRLTEVGPVTLSTGGAVSNTGINLRRLGIRTQLMGKIGDDLFGQAILSLLESHDRHLPAGMIVVPGETSSYTLVIDPPGVDRLFLHFPGANRTFGAADVRYDLLARTRLYHFGYPALMARMYGAQGRELADMLARVRQAGATTCLDMAMPDPAGASGRVDWHALLANALPHVDFFVPSAEELLFMLRRERFEELAGRVGTQGLLSALLPAEIVSLAGEALQLGARVVVLKLHTRGLCLCTAAEIGELGRAVPVEAVPSWAGRRLWAPAFRPEREVSTVGSGDAAIAGFLAALLRGSPPARALQSAAAVGASCVEATGALSGVRSWAETLSRLDAGWPRLPLDLAQHGWSWLPERGVWRLEPVGSGEGDRTPGVHGPRR